MILESLNPIIEHIGSTSIQFLSAKPIIDIAVGIKNTSELDLTIDPMIKNQFIYYEVYNKVIPEARGKAEKIVSEAEGYAAALVNRAEGDVAKFKEVLKEYKRAPRITKKRLYIEAMEGLYKNYKNLTIIDPKVKGLLPVFDKGGK